MALAACGDEAPPADAKFFSSVEECSTQYDAAVCQEALVASQKISDEQAPRYARKEDCEAELGVGNCEERQTTSGGSIFMPLIMGYMLGNMLSNNRFNQPVYRGPNNEAVMPRNGRFFNVGTFGAGAGKATGFQQAAQVTPVKRGGFGGTSKAFYSGGGS
jgi:uncharacterized protein YgiB involved in biofilm formation